jgi:hypothetical protein
MKTNARHHFSFQKTSMKFKKLLSSPKIIGVIREIEHWIGMRIAPIELINLNEYSSTLSQRIGKNYQSQTKKSNFVCVSSSASAYNLTHNEISANIEKHQKLSEARWNDNLIEYICNH